MSKDVPRAVEVAKAVPAGTLKVGDRVYSPTSRHAVTIESLLEENPGGGTIIKISVGGEKPFSWSVPATMQIRKVQEA